jgi:hypothetical protein
MTGPQLDYETPGSGRTPTSAMLAFAGVFASLAGGPGVMFLAAWLGGVSGLLFGALSGALVVLVALIVGIVQSRSPDGRLRGFGIGLIIGSGLSLLGAGACFVGIR